MKKTGSKYNWAAFFYLLIGLFIILFPLYLTIINALKTPQEMAESVLKFPSVFRLSNFSRAIEMTNFFRSFTNSFLITFFAVIITVFTNSLVSYAIARNLDKKFFKYIYYYFISALFIPFPIIMLPIVRQTAQLKLDNQIGLVFLYVVYGLAFNIFIYVGYIRSIPHSLEEAAFIDGAGIWKVFWKIIFPLMAPINATVSILSTVWIWNDFMLPLVILNEPESMTLPLVQFVFKSQFSTNYNLAFSSYLMVMLPLILVYIVSEKWIISGVTRGAIK